MALRFIAIVVLAGVACTTPTSPTTASASPPQTPCSDRVGNVLPCKVEVDEATWTRLGERPLVLPTVSAGAACPATPTRPLGSGTTDAAGDYPIYAAGNVIAFGAPDAEGFHPSKVLWFAHPDYRGPALIRGLRLDAPGDVRFGQSTPPSELRFPLETGVRAEGSGRGWRYLPSNVKVEAAGCYGFQIDGPDWTTVIVMIARI